MKRKQTTIGCASLDVLFVVSHRRSYSFKLRDNETIKFHEMQQEQELEQEQSGCLRIPIVEQNCGVWLLVANILCAGNT